MKSGKGASQPQQHSPPRQGGMLAAAQAFQAALLLQQQGRLDEAASLYQGVLKRDRGHFDSLHNLGLLRLQQGKPALALKLVQKALYRSPNSAEAHNTLGLSLYSLNRHEEAIAHYEKALGIRPNYAEALSNLGSALRALNRHEEAIASYRQALSVRPQYAGAQFNLGNVFRALGRREEAIAHYKQALAVNRDHEAAYTNMGAALLELGRLEEARRLFEEAIKFVPNKAAFYASLAESKRFAAGDPYISAMEDLARDMAALSENEQIHLHFALAKALADVGKHEQSFRHLLEGNALKRQGIKYDEATTLGELERIRGAFTPDLMRSREGVGNPSVMPVFVLGMPRSGTTLVEQILASHPMVFGAGEIENFNTTVEGLCQAKGVRGTFPELVTCLSGEQLHQLGTNYLGGVSAMAPAAARITDKMPANFRFVGLIHLAMPNARIIHTRRDPVDTCLSCFSKLFVGDQPHTYELGEVGRYYRTYETLMKHWRSVLPEGTLLEVQYEEVVADLEGQARRIVARCGLEWDDACLAFYKTQRPVLTASATQVRQPIYRSSVGRWHPVGHLIEPLLRELRPILPDEKLRQ